MQLCYTFYIYDFNMGYLVNFDVMEFKKNELTMWPDWFCDSVGIL